MLTHDRPAMAARAIKCWSEQDYPQTSTRLLIYDTGYTPFNLSADALGLKCRYSDGHTGVLYQRGCVTDKIGTARNKANAYASQNHYGFRPHDVIIHFDDDDWSAPTRISDQVKLLVESGKQAVGYREMLFADVAPFKCDSTGEMVTPLPEVWLYRNTDPRYCTATS